MSDNNEQPPVDENKLLAVPVLEVAVVGAGLVSIDCRRPAGLCGVVIGDRKQLSRRGFRRMFLVDHEVKYASKTARLSTSSL